MADTFILPELLAPAGNPEMLHAAVRAGADAVYLGTQDFNARRNAKNFDDESLADALSYCHLRNVKVYVAMNTLILDCEMKSALAAAQKCFELGADAFIVQDLGLLMRLKKLLPNARIHASTQMSIHSADGILACADLGVSRITLARELSLEKICDLVKVASELGIELETFAHGAICVSYSGQCLMSSMIGGRSANRGVCAQACRLEYELQSDSSDANHATVGKHLLSPKDLCTIDLLNKFVDAGVSSLKIEGRMKSAEYVFAAVSVYREALDRLVDLPVEHCKLEQTNRDDNFIKNATSRLESTFSRGFYSGYLFGDNSNEMMAYARPNNRGESIGRVKNVANDSISFSANCELQCGDIVEIWTSRGNETFSLENNFVQVSKNATVNINGSIFSKVHLGDRVFRVRSAAAKYVDDEREPRVNVSGRVKLNIGSPIEMTFWPTCDTNICSSITGDNVEAARTRSVSADEVFDHVNRLGQTPFVIESLDIDLDEGVGLSFSQLHKLRAEALAALEALILQSYKNTRSVS